jgi:hypothetical protein
MIKIKGTDPRGRVQGKNGMKFTGDPEGIAALKKMKETRMEYLKYLLQEARTNFDRTATFKENEKTFKIVFDPQTGDLDVTGQG